MSTAVATELRAAERAVVLGTHVFLVVSEADDGTDWNGVNGATETVLLHWTGTTFDVVDTLDALGAQRPVATQGRLYYRSNAVPAAGDESSLRYRGWRVVLACFLMALFLFGFGLYGAGVYLAELQRLNGWPASLIAGASTLSLLLGNMLVAFTSELVAWLGLKRLALLGIAALAGSMALLSFASAPWLLYAAFTLMSLGWVGMGTK